MSEGGLEQQQLVLSSRRKFAKYFLPRRCSAFGVGPTPSILPSTSSFSSFSFFSQV